MSGNAMSKNAWSDRRGPRLSIRGCNMDLCIIQETHGASPDCLLAEAAYMPRTGFRHDEPVGSVKETQDEAPNSCIILPQANDVGEFSLVRLPFPC